MISKTSKFDKLYGKAPDDALAFIKIWPSVCGKKNKDVKDQIYFLAINNAKEYFVIEPPFQIPASKCKFDNLKQWGIDLTTKSSIELNPCTDESHGSHAFLLPFFGNDRLLRCLDKVKD